MKRLILTLLIAVSQLCTLQSQVSVDHSTGTAYTSIPLFTLDGIAMQFDVSLSNVSSGIQVASPGGNVGYGWDLQMPGRIDRQIRGIQDELIPAEDENRAGFLWCSHFFQEEDGTFNPSTEWIDKVAKQEYDFHPDKFELSAPGLEGTFYFSPGSPQPLGAEVNVDSEVVFIPHRGYEVEFEIENGSISNFVVTNELGVKYFFEESQSQVTSSYCHGNTSGTHPTVQNEFVSSWFLTRIEDMNGHIELEVLYEHSNAELDFEVQHQYHTILSSEDVYSSINGANVSSQCPGSDLLTHCFTKVIYEPTMLKELKTRAGRIAFSYTAPRLDIPNHYLLSNVAHLTAGGTVSSFSLEYSEVYDPAVCWENECRRPILSRLQQLNTNNSPVGNATEFEYFEGGLPKRSSMDIDLWGYYNYDDQRGPNESLVPLTVFENYNTFWLTSRAASLESSRTGALKCIRNPLGGTTCFDYELNEYSSYLSGQELEPESSHEKIAEVSANYSLDEPNETAWSESFTVNETQTFRFYTDIFTFANYDNGYPSSQIIDLSDNSVAFEFAPGTLELYTSSTRYPDAWQDITLEAGTYQLKCQSSGWTSPIPEYMVKAELYSIEIVTEAPTHKTGGGLRLKSLVVDDGDPDTSNNLIESYDYGQGAESTGIMLSAPLNHRTTYNELEYHTTAYFYVAGDLCPDPCVYEYLDTYDCGYLSLMSQSMAESMTHHGSPILYQQVRVSTGGQDVSAGYTDFVFSTGNITQDYEVPVAPETQGAFEIGNPLKTTHFNSDGEPVHEIEYSYSTEDLENIPSVRGITFESTGLAGNLFIEIDHAEQYMEQEQEEAALLSTLASIPTFFIQGPAAGIGQLLATTVIHLVNNRIQNQYEADITVDDQSYNVYVSEEYSLQPQSFVLENITNRYYDQVDPSRYVEDITSFQYGTESQAYPRRIVRERTNTDDKVYQTFTYAHEIQPDDLPDEESSAISQLNSRGASHQLLEAITTIGPNLPESIVVAGTSTSFKLDDNNNIVESAGFSYFPPALSEGFVSYEPIHFNNGIVRSEFFDEAFAFTNHDDFGSAVEWQQVHGPPSAILVHPETGKVLANIQNASSSEIAYTSFEDEFQGGWQYNIGGPNEESIAHLGLELPNAKTGVSSFNLTNSQIIRAIEQGKYIVALWCKGIPELTLTGNGTIEPTVEETADQLGWQYREFVIVKEDDAPTTLFIGANEPCQVDELRFFPYDAMFGSTCFGPFGRIVSTSDQNGRTTRYVYHEDGHLEWTLDDNWEIRSRSHIEHVDQNNQNAHHLLETVTAMESGLTTSSFTPAAQMLSDGTFHALSFLDGLGRPVQSQITKCTALNRNLVQHHEYDALGHESKKWLPFSKLNPEHQFLLDADSECQSFHAGTTWIAQTAFPFAQEIIEESPLQRVIEAGSPGESWQPGENTLRATYTVNDDFEVLRWTANENELTAGGVDADYFEEATLTKVIESNEDNKIVERFYDQFNRLVLLRKKVWSYLTSDYSYSADFSHGQDPESIYPEPPYSGYVNHDTYYLYNHSGMIVAEIAAHGIEQLSQTGDFTIPVAGGNDVFEKACYYNSYDSRGRLITSKSPDQTERKFIYNLLNQVTMFQNAYLADDETLNWQTVCYDALGRAVLGGFITTEQSHQELLELWAAQIEGLWVSRDDQANYGYTENALFPLEKAHSVFFYDQRGIADLGNSYEGNEELSERTRAKLLVRWSEIQSDQGGHLATSFFYNEKGHICQAVEQHLEGGQDRLSYQYDFPGMIVSMEREHTFGEEELTITNTFEYDKLGKPSIVRQRTGDDPEIILSKSIYNEIGQLVKKHLHIGPGDNTGMQVMDYRYNVRGWLRKINNSNLVDDGDNLEDFDVFGEELIYTAEDQLMPWGGSPYNSGNAIKPQEFRSGLVSAIKWNSKSPEEPVGLLREKSYVYRYDDLGRLTGASFAMENLDLGSGDYGQFSASKNIFLESVQYDLGGNIRKLTRNRPNYNWSAPEVSDHLQLAFQSASNQATEINDLATTESDPNFSQFVDSGVQVDREFDAAGFLTEDFNNKLSYSYNKLGLVSAIAHDDHPQEPMLFTYNSGGQLLCTQIADTTTYYLNGIEYVDTGNGPDFRAAGTGEGAVRKKEEFETNSTEYVYDYFIRDHLGNVRVIITEGNAVQVVEQVTMEVQNAQQEESQFDNVSESRSPVPTEYPLATLENQKVAELSSNSTLVGPGKLIEVRRGDIIDVSAESWYLTAPLDNPMTSIGDILTAIAAGMLTQGGGIVPNGEAGVTDLLNSESVVNGGISNFLLDQLDDADWSQPQAYLVYMTFTRDLRLVGALSGVIGIGDEGAVELLEIPEVMVNQDGYFYAFVTNYSTQEVVFDNFTMVHQQGKIRGEYDYYPYGLLWNNPSDNEEYSQTYQSKNWLSGNWGDTGIDLYNFHARLNDPVLASWQIPDPMNQFSSPYTSMANNPVSFVDPDGMFSFPIGSWVRKILGRTPGTGQRLIGGRRGLNLNLGGFFSKIALGAVNGLANALSSSTSVVQQNAGKIAANVVADVKMQNLQGQVARPIYAMQYDHGSTLNPLFLDYKQYTRMAKITDALGGSDADSKGISIVKFWFYQEALGFITNNYSHSSGVPTVNFEVYPQKIVEGYNLDSQTYVDFFDSSGNWISTTNASQSDIGDNAIGRAGRNASITLPKLNGYEWGDSYVMEVRTQFQLYSGQNPVGHEPKSLIQRFRIWPLPPKNAPRIKVKTNGSRK